MDEVTTLLDQARLFALQHAPNEMLRSGVLMGVVFLIAGVGISVLGAKLVRFGVTSAAVVLGSYVGMDIARSIEWAPLLGMLVGAFLIGIIGFQTFRLWVGVGTSIVLTCIVMGAFGYQKLVPHVTEFQARSPAAVASTGMSGTQATFTVPTEQQRHAYAERSPRQWWTEFWSYLTERDRRIANAATGLAALSLLVGLCIGLIAWRWTLILSTSILGTVLVTSGVASLMTNSIPDSYQAFQKNPGLGGILVGAFLLTSMILQALLSRSSASDKSDAPA